MLDKDIADLFQGRVIKLSTFHQLLAEVTRCHELLIVVITIGILEQFFYAGSHCFCRIIILANL